MKWKQWRILLHDVPQLELFLDVSDVWDDADDIILAHLNSDVFTNGHFVSRPTGIEQISCTERHWVINSADVIIINRREKENRLPARIVVARPGLETVCRPPACDPGLRPPPQADPGPGHGLDLDVGLRGGEHEVRGHVPHTHGGEGDGAAQGVDIVITGPGETRNNRICDERECDKILTPTGAQNMKFFVRLLSSKLFQVLIHYAVFQVDMDNVKCEHLNIKKVVAIILVV